MHGDLAVEYYAQRAGAGLIITEGTQPSAVGQGYRNTPGLHSPEQVAGWRRVADAVHARGGRIVAQLMHAGRVSHPDNTGGLAPSPRARSPRPGEMFTATGGMQPHPVPRALDARRDPRRRRGVRAGRPQRDRGRPRRRRGARRQRLPDPPVPRARLQPAHRRVRRLARANRARFGIEVTRAVAEAIGADRVGIRLSPAHNIQGCTEDDPADVEATYAALAEAIAPLGLAYVSVLSADPRTDAVSGSARTSAAPFIINTGFGDVTTRESAQALLDDDLGDAVAVGPPVHRQPRPAARWETGAELNEPDPDTFYGGGAEGYTDYPALDETA